VLLLPLLLLLASLRCSARSDQFNEEKKQLLQHIIQSFKLR
jgi:hypothetical protein